MSARIAESKDKTILNVIRYFLREENQSPSYLDLTFYCGISPKTTARILRRLEAFKHLRIKRSRGMRNQYVIQEQHVRETN